MLSSSGSGPARSWEDGRPGGWVKGRCWVHPVCAAWKRPVEQVLILELEL